ncbi:MAG: carotenoid biosynthesis protein [Candidatus Rokubacteria bacterium]|nr:carotenoid biosynthesis protein [Candidatus Rokubacteria bacterium]
MDLLVATLWLRPYVFLFLAAFLVAGTLDLGWRRALVFGGIVWPVAFIAEYSSTRTGVPFGLYHYTDITRGRELYIADVPFMDSLSFAFLAYAAFCLARAALARRRASPLTIALLAGALMMLLDVVIDPLAVRGDRWFLGRIFFYPHGGAYFGVPLSNFAGWWLVGTVGVGAFMALAGGYGRRPALGIALYYAVLAFNLGVTMWIGEGGLAGLGTVLHLAAATALIRVSRKGESERA